MARKSTIATKTISALTARTQLGQILDLTRQKQARFVVARNGRPTAIILGIEDYLESVVDVPEALKNIQSESRRRGSDLLSQEDIDTEIKGSRKKRVKKGRS